MIAMRAATPDDAEAITAIYAPYVVTNAVSFESTPPDEAEMRGRIDTSLYPWIIAHDPESGTVLGYAFAKPAHSGPNYRFAVETACYIAEAVEGRGLRRTLYGALIQTLIAQNFTQAIARFMLPNERLIELHEQNGFRRAGVLREMSFKNGRWNDVGLWQRSLAEPVSPPDEIGPFGQVGVVTG